MTKFKLTEIHIP